jgi:MFS transporter, NNP family, nitrate/nitrite transporter
MPKATRIEPLNFASLATRNFHLAWASFFVSFLAWFAVAPLTGTIAAELNLTKGQIANAFMGGVGVTILARLVIGWMSDRFGPRRVYGWMMLLCAFPVCGLGLVTDATSFFWMRVLVGVVGASFVVTQHHTSAMYAPNCVGFANATAAGIGNSGGGAANMVMPGLVGLLAAFGLDESGAWRWSFSIPGVMLFILGICYLRFATDTPDGNLNEEERRARAASGAGRRFAAALGDPRVGSLFFAYGACFGVELILHNFAATYFTQTFGLSVGHAGIAAGSFGVMALIARPLGGWFGDRAGRKAGINGRARFLGCMLVTEGIALAAFALSGALWLAIPTMLIFAIATHMSAGATYAVIPLLRQDSVGAVSGIVGAGGNLLAFAIGFLFKIDGIEFTTIFLILAGIVGMIGLLPLILRFEPNTNTEGAIESAAVPA